ncbi:MAG TPA: MCP four helix bundle domain-containing protein, partial [Steroidobacteraceae bacterium]|nr:MCP four helix bundle domain-containing protein [Steroidobacteraceae bacterium]
MVIRRSVTTRIFAAFAVIIVVFGAALGLSLKRLSDFNKAVSNVADVSLTKFEVANAWSEMTSQSATQLRNLLVVSDADTIAAEIAEVKQDTHNAAESMDALGAITRAGSDDAGVLFQAVVQARKNYVGLQDEFLQQVAANKLDDARETLFTRAKGPEIAYFTELVQLRDIFRSQLRDQTNAVAASYRKVRLIVAAIALTALLIAGVLAWWIARSVRNPLAQAVGVLDSIESGHLDTLIPAQSSDEPGRVLSALDRMQTALRNRIDKDRAMAEENARIRTALDRIGAGAMVADLDGKIIYANDYVKEIFRLRGDEIRKHLPQFDSERIFG